MSNSKPTPNEDDPRADKEKTAPFVTAIGQFRSGRSWYVAFAFRDGHGTDQVRSLPRRDCIRPFALRALLADAGAPLAGDAQRLQSIVEQVVAGCLPTIEPASVSGWHGAAYLFGQRFIGKPDGKVVILSDEWSNTYTLEASPDGSSAMWREAVRDLPRYSYALTLGICIAFASVMAGPLGIEPRIVHFYGTSTTGKTLLLILARSVLGNPSRDRLPSWNTTAAAFEELAAQVRDHLLVIDEVTFKAGGFDDEQLLRRLHYAFASNQAMRRSRRYEPAQVVVGQGSSKLGLSTGELSYREVAKRAGSKRFRGAVLRAIDIASDLEYGMGVFRRLPSDFAARKDGARRFAQSLEVAALANYGRTGRRFIDHLISGNPGWKDDARRRKEDFVGGLNLGDDGYLTRFAEIFGLAHAAGREAIAAGLVDWSATDLRHAIERMYGVARQCLSTPAEACEDVLAKLRRELSNDAVEANRRIEIDDETFNRANAFFRKDPALGPVYLVKPQFLESLCGVEVSTRDIALALDKAKVLVRDPTEPALPTRQVMIGSGRPKSRYYCIRASFVRP